MKRTTSEILEGLKSKDDNVFIYLAKTYSAMIIGHVRKNSGTEEEGREIVQLTLMRLWIAVRDGRYKEEGMLNRYIFQLAANIWKEELRRKKRKPTETLNRTAYAIMDESEDALARAVVKNERLEAIHQALENMGEPCKQIIKWFHLEQVGLKEISERLDYNYNALRKRIHDCRNKLKVQTHALLNYTDKH
ncbi:MAG: sigma-70 family RNA polymerase sigma factor [Chitinophagales bacterium]|nr:sigma-70 family RNA polymerase sigma factor [Chitinophagales bacterium]